MRGYKITYKWLLKEGACLGERKRFKKLFPNGAYINKKNLIRYVRSLGAYAQAIDRLSFLGYSMYEEKDFLAMYSEMKDIEYLRGLETIELKEELNIDEEPYRLARYNKKLDKITRRFNEECALCFLKFFKEHKPIIKGG